MLLCLVDVTNWHSIPMELIYGTKLLCQAPARDCHTKEDNDVTCCEGRRIMTRKTSLQAAVEGCTYLLLAPDPLLLDNIWCETDSWLQAPHQHVSNT